MHKLRNVWVILIIIIINIQSLSAGVLAYDETESGVFSDLTVDNPYYEAITNLAEFGIIKGYSDNTVRPDRYVTVAEVIALIQRTVKGQSDIDWDWFRNREFMLHSDSILSYNSLFLGKLSWWPSLELVKPQYDEDMTKLHITVGDVANMILGAYRLSSIRPTLYGFNHEDFSSIASFIIRGYDINKIVNDIVNVNIELYNSDTRDFGFIRRTGGYVSGYDFQFQLSEDYDIINAVEDTIATRGEVCDLLYWAISSRLADNRNLEFDESIKAKIIEPSMAGDIDIYEYMIEDQRVYQEICYNTLQLPEDLREMYREFGGRLSYLDSIAWELTGNPVEAVGKFSYDDLSITLSESNRAVYHEFGHFLHLVGKGTIGKVSAAFENRVEFDELLDLNTFGYDYGLSSPSEFFAESFSIYMTNRDYFSEECPVYYDIITDALDSLKDVMVEYRNADNHIILYLAAEDFDLSVQDGVVSKIYHQSVTSNEDEYIDEND